MTYSAIANQDQSKHTWVTLETYFNGQREMSLSKGGMTYVSMQQN